MAAGGEERHRKVAAPGGGGHGLYRSLARSRPIALVLCTTMAAATDVLPASLLDTDLYKVRARSIPAPHTHAISTVYDAAGRPASLSRRAGRLPLHPPRQGRPLHPRMRRRLPQRCLQSVPLPIISPSRDLNPARIRRSPSHRRRARMAQVHLPLLPRRLPRLPPPVSLQTRASLRPLHPLRAQCRPRRPRDRGYRPVARDHPLGGPPHGLSQRALLSAGRHRLELRRAGRCAAFSTPVAVTQLSVDPSEQAYAKGEELIKSGCAFSEFGTRRRRSFHAHDIVIRGLVRAARDFPGPGKLTGTSNVSTIDTDSLCSR